MTTRSHTASARAYAALPQALLRKYAAGFFAGVGPNAAKTIGHYATEALGRQAAVTQNSTNWFSGLRNYFNRGAKAAPTGAATNVYSNLSATNFGASPATSFIGDISGVTRASPPAANVNISPVNRFTVHNMPSYGAMPENGFTTTFSGGAQPSSTRNATGQQPGAWDRIKGFFRSNADGAEAGIIDDTLDDSFWASRRDTSNTRARQPQQQPPNFGEWWNGLLNTRIGHNATVGDYPLAVAAGGLYLGGRGLDLANNAIGGAPQPYYPQPYYPHY